MDIKSKKSKPFTAWLSFFLAVNLIGLLIFISLAAVSNLYGNFGILQAPFCKDFKDTRVFKIQTNEYFRQLISVAEELSAAASVNEEVNQDIMLEVTENNLTSEGANLKYYVSNQDSGRIFKNFEADVGNLPDSLPPGYDYVWYFDGQKLSVFNHGKAVDIHRLDSGYRDLVINYSVTAHMPPHSRVVLAVKDSLVKNAYGHSAYYQQQSVLPVLGWICLGLILLSLVLFVHAFIHRSEKREYEKRLAGWSGSMWIEVKAVISLLLLILLLNLSISISSWSNPLDWLLYLSFIGCCILFVLWWFYLLLLDLIVHKKAFFSHNIINSIMRSYRRFESRYPWQQAMLRRIYTLVAVEAVMALIAVVCVLGAFSGDIILLLIAVLLTAAGVSFIWRFLRKHVQMISDMGKLVDQIESIKNGDMLSHLELSPGADLVPAAQNLNVIQEGMNRALAERLKSERMKIDLITNVSHDLKTPLTSIISYVDLLSREEDLPEHVNDYIRILGQKAARLNNLIQDLFDLSKASSQNIVLDLETIDLSRLMKQTLADMDEQINASGLDFRLNLPEQAVYIHSDGKKLYRVWENLIANTLKYALPGSRVFIDLQADGEEALAVIKNIANYEMNFSEEDILQRFVRGEESRSTEGSGLGLSIAQSFTQLCGGTLAIRIDGDLFKAELRFKTVT